MDSLTGREGIVDPEVRAYVYSLVNAVGGSSLGETGSYELGDDAIACLKDIKRWLTLYDDKANRLDVARCLAEANLVRGDLLEILASWSNGEGVQELRAKVSLVCLELLMRLTWPLEMDEMTTTRNHHRHMPYLKMRQIEYKRDILEHPTCPILQTVMRLAIPSIALPLKSRSMKDKGIIKLLLLFYKNIAVISAPNHHEVDWNEREVSRNNTIRRFSEQGVFDLILTISSNMGEDFDTDDVTILEILFHLVKGVDVDNLFMRKSEIKMRASKDLKYLMAQEEALLFDFKKNAPTRHNNFGTMIWVKRDDEKVKTMSGQDILGNEHYTLNKIDKSKKFNAPKRKTQEESGPQNFDSKENLDDSSRRQLRSFVEEFLDSGFNPLFAHVRKAIEREADRVLMNTHASQFFYLIGWFLQAERARRRHAKPDPSGKTSTGEDYGLIAAPLNQETFILLNRYMQKALDEKRWHEVDASMRCFSEILTTVQDMALSPLEDDQEIAENIQSRIFYEESTHDRIVHILRTYKNQSFSYLDAATELAHVFLRVLEKYSKENEDMQIRSRRRARKKKAQQAQTQEGDVAAIDVPDEENQASEQVAIQNTIRERRFNFQKFASKFTTQGCVDTFIKFIGFYRDLNNEQLKRAHRYFYRVAFKQEMCVMLFRMDIISMFNTMIKGPDGMSSANAMYKEWSELVKQVFRKLVKKLEERPDLFVELLFSKTPWIAFYLENGYDKESLKVTKPRIVAELEMNSDLSQDEQIGVAVALLQPDDGNVVQFVMSKVHEAYEERRAFEAEDLARAESLPEGASPQPTAAPPAITVDGQEILSATNLKNNKFLLLLKQCGIVSNSFHGDPNAQFSIPPEISSSQLLETHASLAKHHENPTQLFGEDSAIAAEDLVKRKVAPRARVEFDDDDENDDFLDDTENPPSFVPVRDPNRRKANALDELKKKRKSRTRQRRTDNEVDDELRRQKRAAAEMDKISKIKSTLYVHSSDDETDEERDRQFFAKEEERRRAQAATASGEELLAQRGKAERPSKKRKSKGTSEEHTRKRNRTLVSAGASSDEEDLETSGGILLSESEADDFDSSSSTPRRPSEGLMSDNSDSDADIDEGAETDAEALTTLKAHLLSTPRKRRRTLRPVRAVSVEEDEPASSSSPIANLNLDSEVADNLDDTPLSSQSQLAQPTKRLSLNEVAGNARPNGPDFDFGKDVMELDSDEDDVGEQALHDKVTGAGNNRRGARALVLDDSD